MRAPRSDSLLRDDSASDEIVKKPRELRITPELGETVAAKPRRGRDGISTRVQERLVLRLPGRRTGTRNDCHTMHHFHRTSITRCF